MLKKLYQKNGIIVIDVLNKPKLHSYIINHFKKELTMDDYQKKYYHSIGYKYKPITVN